MNCPYRDSSRLSLMPLKSDCGFGLLGASWSGSNTGTFMVLVRSEKSIRVARLLAESALRIASSLVIWPVLNSLYRSEEHTSELQSQSNLVCPLLLEILAT